jgi:methylmalonyl-CoA mutase
MFETLTEELAEKAWRFFQDIEREGGMTQALMSNFVSGKIATVQAERAKNLARRKDAITGVSEFPNVYEAPVKTRSVTARKPAPTGAALILPPAGGGKLMEAFVAAADSAPMASYVAALKGGTGASITPFPVIRLAQDFEQLRDAADAFKDTHGGRPKVFLANIGTVADFTARATFAKNFYEAGGFEAVGGDGGNDTSDLVRAFKASGANVAVICSTDALYAAQAVALARALKDAGAAALHVAGRGGDLETALKGAGVDDFIFIGCDVLGVLKALNARAGIGQ